MNRTAPPSGTRGLQRHLITAVLIRLADEGARVALVLLALERTKSAAVCGLLVTVLLVPQVVSTAIGLITDRARQPRWVLTTSVDAFAASLLPWLSCLDVSRYPWLSPCCCSADAVAPASPGGLTSQLPTLAAESSLPRAFGADSLTYSVSGIAGPAAVTAIGAGAAGAATSIVALAAIAAAGGLVLATLLSSASRPAGPAPFSRDDHAVRLPGMMPPRVRGDLLRWCGYASLR